jgi:hypothetical protein
MKKIFFIDSVRSGAAVLLLALLCLLPCARVSAQGVPTPCQSVWTDYSPIEEETSIVRSDNLYRVVHVQQEDPLTGEVLHTFVIRSNYLGTEVAFTTYLTPNAGTVSSIKITDMRLYNGECYFCGTLDAMYLDPLGNPVTHGIVGHFSPQAIMSSSGYVSYYIVDETSHLTRLAVNKASNQLVLVSIIGYRDHGTTSCMVELKQTGIMSWTIRLDYLESPDDILFSDIMYAGDSITLLSQMRCANDFPPNHSNYDPRHQMFLLDRFSKDGCNNDYNPYGIHYMAHYYVNDACHGNFHLKGFPMRLCHINDGYYGFGVAYGVEETAEYQGGIRLFPFNDAWRYDSSIYYRTGHTSIIKDIGNLHGTDRLFVVSEDASNPQGVVTLPMLGSATHDVPRLVDPNYTYNSAGQCTGTVNIDIDITGHDGSSYYTLFQQNITDLTLPSCFNKPVFHYSVFPEKRAAELVVKWKFIDLDMRQWEYPEITEIEVKTDKLCRKCGEN